MKKNIWKKRLHALIIGLAIVLFWRGTWLIADHVIFPKNELTSGIVSILIGIVVLVSSKRLIEALD